MTSREVDSQVLARLAGLEDRMGRSESDRLAIHHELDEQNGTMARIEIAVRDNGVALDGLVQSTADVVSTFSELRAAFRVFIMIGKVVRGAFWWIILPISVGYGLIRWAAGETSLASALEKALPWLR